LHCNNICAENIVTSPIQKIKSEPTINPRNLKTTGKERIPAPIIVFAICIAADIKEEVPSP
jgi:hypothetical protein